MPTLRFKPIRHYDGTYLDEIEMSGDTVVRKRSQPARNQILETVKRMRLEGVTKDSDHAVGRWTLSIPKSDYWNLVAINPDLQSPDIETQTKAWDKFIASSESLPYRVYDYGGKTHRTVNGR